MRRSKLLWLLAAVVCLGGLCLAHQTPAVFILSTPIIPAQAEATTTPGAPMVISTVKTIRESQMTTTTSQPITLTIVYDNHPFDARLKTGWGFACLVETGRARVLFDTGGDGPALRHNLAVLGIDPRQVDSVVLSHYHDDHTGGLEAVLGAANQPVVYAPRSFPAEFKTRVRQVAPCHCTGEEAIQQFKAEFGADFIPVGTGSLIYGED